MALSDELAYVTATELALRIRRRQLSAVEVVDAFIGRIEQRNKSLNAFVYFGFEDARKRAKEADQALLAGAALGPLHGVPTAMKDLFDFKPGWVSTFGGVRALKQFVVDSYCTYAERIEKAGAILLGKTNSPVMGFRGTCDNYLSISPPSRTSSIRGLTCSGTTGMTSRHSTWNGWTRAARCQPATSGMTRRYGRRCMMPFRASSTSTIS